VTVVASGGTPGYRYLWSTGSASPNLVNVAAGSYSVVVTDANNCTSQSAAQVGQPTAVTVSIQTTDISCFGAADGGIQVTANGGTPSYTYTWTNGSSSQNLSNLGPGVFGVTVFDANNCTGSDIARINEPDEILINLSSTPDNGTGTGTATAMATGGTAPFTYAWGGGLTGPTITNLFAGNYIVTVTDANNCSKNDTIFVGSNVSIDDLFAQEVKEIKVFPNPSSGLFQLEIQLLQSQHLTIQVVDLTGKGIWFKEVNQTISVKEEIDLGALPAGVYFLQVKGELGQMTRQLMIR